MLQVRAGPGGGRRRAVGHPGPDAGPDGAPVGLRVPPALLHGRGVVFPRAAGGGRAGAGAFRVLSRACAHDGAGEVTMMTTDNRPYIRVENLKKYFSTKRGMLHAVDDEIGRAHV